MQQHSGSLILLTPAAATTAMDQSASTATAFATHNRRVPVLGVRVFAVSYKKFEQIFIINTGMHVHMPLSIEFSGHKFSAHRKNFLKTDHTVF